MIAFIGIEDLVFEIANALRAPVFIAALGALAIVVFELGAFFVELARRRRREGLDRLRQASSNARLALDQDDVPGAAQALLPLASSAPMAETLSRLVAEYGQPGANDHMAKCLADFDLRSLRRLERTRMLVRFGPALGLMGTLIPLAPALSGLARGDVKELSENLQVAFSVTVLGLLVGAVAFTVSLVRDRLYAQDLSDLEYVAASLGSGEE